MPDTPESQSVQEPHDSAAEHSPRTEPVSDPADVTPPLASLIAAIRASVARGASAEARIAGATACRSILTELEAKPGQPLVALPPPPPAASTSATSPIAALFSQPGVLSRLAAMSRDDLINLVKQVTGAVQPRPQTPTSGAPRFHLIQIPASRRPDSE
jgi:hypothetical protein